MKAVIGLLSCLTIAEAFAPPNPTRVASSPHRKDDKEVASFIYEGVIPPLGKWDPLNLEKLPRSDLRRYREAELQHGRVAMTSSVAFALIEQTTHKPAISFLSDQPWQNQAPYWIAIMCAEIARLTTGWAPPSASPLRLGKLKDEYQPGNVFGVDPVAISGRQYNTELSNGRLAMIGLALTMGREIVESTNA
tara:strand:+ start:1167 stop:1742 length:576 start_codon:yes stop_codon:yes gene_type:complete